ncbi:MAG TPA: hypothetical protein VFF27_14500 [Bacteroidia bacterium]|jgi:hypothetical protein|nr:hypothetical protein [Bacteroidia bacterium]
MQTKWKLLLTVVTTLLFLSFTTKKPVYAKALTESKINNCFISFKGISNLIAADPDRLPENADKLRILKTERGDANVSRTDGYKILYLNDKKAEVVNLKVELSDEKAYEQDQKNLVDNLAYLNSHSTGMESENLLEFKINGYKIVGFSRASVEKGNILGTFVLFPGNGISVFFYFNNMSEEGSKNFASIEEYKKQRELFFKEYTSHLNSCKKK